MTAPFCGDCNRIRLTADGAIRNCLFSNDEVPIRDLMRMGADDEAILAAVQKSVSEKRQGHGIDESGFIPPNRPMYSIGG